MWTILDAIASGLGAIIALIQFVISITKSKKQDSDPPNQG